MRKFIGKIFIISVVCLGIISLGAYSDAVTIKEIKPDECVGKYVKRIKGSFDQAFYQQVIGAANPFKEGDEAIGVAADDQVTRYLARRLLANTKIKVIHEHPLFIDDLQKLIWDTVDQAQYNKVKDWTFSDLKEYLLTKSEAEIKAIMFGLDSDVVGCVTKIMSNPELCVIGQKVFNPLPGSNLGAKGYMSARIQPNSPTDDPEDIVWQIFDAWCYATGDLVVGCNPVSDSVKNILAIQEAMRDVVVTFGLDQVIPWCVLAHIDKQYACEKEAPGSTTFWFQSLAGCDTANAVFDSGIEKMMDYAKMRTDGKFGLYHETGQGADYTNGEGHGFDMVIHESRKYGYSKALRLKVAEVQGKKDILGAWCHTNDVAGFIGPEIFKTREQLVRCCLEDIVMGKLQGVCLGLDICSTLHMPVSLDDLDWCLDNIMPGNPAYLMSLPTKNDPMLSYLTTGYQDHVRCRAKFNYKVNDAMWDFFKKIKIVDANDKYTKHFGDPIWVYYQYCLAKGDKRSKKEIYEAGEAAIKRIEGRGVPIARGHGENPWDMDPELDKRIHALYDDAKISLWTEWSPEAIEAIPNAMVITTQSHDREQFIDLPSTGEVLSESTVASLEKLRNSWAGKEPDVQIAISDGLNTKALMDEGHLGPFLQTVRKELKNAGFTVSEKNLVVKNGRVRAGYAIGDVLFGKADPKKPKAILHIIGERPGSGHHMFSCYISAPKAKVWAEKKVNHDITRVVCGIANTAYDPAKAAKETVDIVKDMTKM